MSRKTLDLADEIHSYRNTFSDPQSAYRFIDSNFLFIDNSHDKVLIPYQGGSDQDSTNEAITNPAMLQSFLNYLNTNQKLVDLVVYDLAIGGDSAEREAVVKELKKLEGNHKLLLSWDRERDLRHVYNFKKSTLANIREYGNQGSYTSHTLYYADSSASLPAKLYQQFTGHRIKRNPYLPDMGMEYGPCGSKTWIRNTFIPAFDLTYEDKLYEDLISERSVGCMDLGFTHNPTGQLLLKEKLIQRREHKYKNIVFIGSFRSDTEDVHQTAHGDLHGPTIILNSFYSLIQRQHVLNIRFIILLACLFFLVHIMIIAKVGHKLNLTTGFERIFIWLERTEIPPSKILSLQKYGKPLYLVYVVIHFIFIEELAFTFLLVALSFADQYGYLINTEYILIYFAVFYAVIQYFGRIEISTKQHHEF